MYNFTQTILSDQKVSLLLAKNGKVLRDGEVIKKCSIKMALAFGDKKMAKQFETLPLSHQTGARRVTKLSEHESAKTKDIVQQRKYYLLWLWTKAYMFATLVSF